MESRAGLNSAYLGELEWSVDAELCFAQGIPGFEGETRMVPIEIPAQRPLVYLQSALHPDVCFMALPVPGINPDFQLHLLPDDYQALEMDPSRTPVPGEDVLCLALLSPSRDGVQVNLAAPVVISLQNQRGHQVITAEGPEIWRLGSNGIWEAMCSS